MGNLLLDKKIYGTSGTLADLLSSMIDEGLKTERPLRLLIFENKGREGKARAPYTACITFGRPLSQRQSWTPETPTTRNDEDTPQWYQPREDAEPEGPPPPPEPTPRPRRTAPRR